MPLEQNLRDLALRPLVEECLVRVELQRQEAPDLVDSDRQITQLRPLVVEILQLVVDSLARTSLLSVLLHQLPIPLAPLPRALPLEVEAQEHSGHLSPQLWRPQALENVRAQETFHSKLS